LVLWESSAIMTHLCIKAGSDMWPAHNPAEQVEIASLAVLERLPLVQRSRAVLF
jgi:hypothetical protein